MSGYFSLSRYYVLGWIPLAASLYQAPLYASVPEATIALEASTSTNQLSDPPSPSSPPTLEASAFRSLPPLASGTNQSVNEESTGHGKEGAVAPASLRRQDNPTAQAHTFQLSPAKSPTATASPVFSPPAPLVNLATPEQEGAASTPRFSPPPATPNSHPRQKLASEHSRALSPQAHVDEGRSLTSRQSASTHQEVDFSIPDLAVKSDGAKNELMGSAPLLQEFITTSAESSSPIIAENPAQPAPSSTSDDETSPPDGTPETPEASTPSDPELGVIQIADPRQDSELGIIQLRNPLQDSELGILRLRTVPPSSPPPSPFLFVSTYVTASSSDNVFLVDFPQQGRISDNFIRPGISLIAFPPIGPRTNVIASVEANFLRYQEETNSSYDELRFRAGVRHRFTDRAYGQLSVSNQLLFDEGFNDQFFTNTGIEVILGRRDPITPRLTLDSYYQGQVFFSDPEEFSNVLNSVGAYLGYRFRPQWDTGIGYRLTISDFTQQSRHETYQRITGQLRYSITPSVRFSLFGGISNGRSSRNDITFDDSFFGISFDATFRVF